MTPQPPALNAPIVLAHGLCGLRIFLGMDRPQREYFPGIRSYLESGGNRVLVPRVSPMAGITTRAAELKSLIRREVGRQPVHVIGHSLGGLDARYMITALGMHKQVLTLTTVGTPHRGTTFADWAVDRFARTFSPILRGLGVPDGALFDLTTERCREFNDRVPDRSEVRYFSVAGDCDPNWLYPGWRLPYGIVGRAEGRNDGVVSVASATWGERTEIWAGDHLNLVNWPNRRMRRAGEWRDRGPQYGNLLAGFENAQV